jgi:hypothetical protein
MSDGQSKRAPLAYENEQFINSPDGRILRILSEYIEPLARFRREQIQDTVVFFGSARFHSRLVTEQNLAALSDLQLSDEQQDLRKKRALAAVDMARYYEEGSRFRPLPLRCLRPRGPPTRSTPRATHTTSSTRRPRPSSC